MYYGGFFASFDTHDIESMQAIVLCLWSFDTQDILLPVTSLIMVRFSIPLNRWNCLSLLYHSMVFILCFYDLYVHVVTVEIYDTK